MPKTSLLRTPGHGTTKKHEMLGVGGGHPHLGFMSADNDEDKEQFIFEHGDLIKANYSKRTAIVANHGIVQGLDVELPSGVTLVIDRFGKHLDLRIEMAASAGGGWQGPVIHGSPDIHKNSMPCV